MSFWNGFLEKYAISLTGVAKGIASGPRSFAPKGSLKHFQPKSGVVTAAPAKTPALPTPKPINPIHNNAAKLPSPSTLPKPPEGMKQRARGVSSTHI